jgi:hypothetical protein
MRSNSRRVIEAAADYIESLYREGKNLISLQTFSGEHCSGKILEQDIQPFPLKVVVTVIDSITNEHQSFDLSEVATIQPLS